MNKDTLQHITSLAFDLHRLTKHKLLKSAAACEDVNLLHIHAIGTIAQQKGITMKELAQKLNVTAPSATALANRLVRDGYIERIRDTKNRTIVHLRVSKTGEKMFREKLAKSRTIVMSLLSVLSEKDQEHLARIFEILTTHLQQDVA